MITDAANVLDSILKERKELHRQLDCVLAFGSVFTEHQGWKDGIAPGETVMAVIKAMYNILPAYARKFEPLDQKAAHK